jgi:hypothetical protein
MAKKVLYKYINSAVLQVAGLSREDFRFGEDSRENHIDRITVSVSSV